MREPKDPGAFADELFTETQDAVKRQTVKAAQACGSHNGVATYIGMMAALGALIPTAMMVGVRPQDVGVEIGEHDFEALQKFAYSQVKPETLTFAALAAVHAMQSITVRTTETAFSPENLGEALDAWQKLFPKAKPEDYLEPAMLKWIAEGRTVSADMKEKYGAFLLPGSKSLN